jgi:hypothetical protein
MDVTLGSLIAGLAALSGWLGKGWVAAKKSGADETKAAMSAEHHLKDFEEFKSETVAEFRTIREEFAKTAANVHERIDDEKKLREESEARQAAAMVEMIRGQGVIEGQLTNMSQTMNQILERALAGGR